MSEKVIPLLTTVYNALNNVTVSGKQNLTNLTVSLKILEDIMEMMAKENEAGKGKPTKKE